MSAIAHDLRLAFRQFRQAPGFTLVVVLTLALGIGATTLFSRSSKPCCCVRSPSASLTVWSFWATTSEEGRISVTAREIGTYSKATSAFTSMGGYINRGYELSGGATPEEIQGARFTAGVFHTLGVQPILGRVFTQQEEESHQPFAVISYALWLNRYHRNPHVLGTSIALDRKAYTIIGVMPRDFEFPPPARTIGPGTALGAHGFSTRRTGRFSRILGISHGGAAQRWCNACASRTGCGPRGPSDHAGFSCEPCAIHIRGDVTRCVNTYVANARPLLQTLFFAVAIVLMIRCINVAVCCLCAPSAGMANTRFDWPSERDLA